MPLHSKIRIFFIAILLVISFNSCNKKKNDVIPYSYVDFTLNLNDPEFVNLGSTFGSAIINSNTNNWRYSGGYDGNGIIIFNGVDQFYAYDRTCPYDFVINGLSVKINVDFTEAVCPKCSTKYSLSANGTPISGAGKYPLKNYKVISYGNSITVTNY
jgi:nitrite reductase/ring-hydroxylating ferredoxin subunit